MIFTTFVIVNSLSEYRDYINRMCEPRRKPQRPLFRGQASSEWRLVSRLSRFVADEFGQQFSGQEFLARQVEDALVRSFKSMTEDISDIGLRTNSIWTWPLLALMQHHGIPTRFLDLSSDELIAAYFAVSGEPGKDGCVYFITEGCGYCMNREEIDERLFGPWYMKELMLFDKPADCRDKRMDNQYAMFAACSGVTDDFEQAIRWTDIKAHAYFVKILIPAASKPGFLRDLDQEGIRDTYIYPKEKPNDWIADCKDRIIQMAVDRVRQRSGRSCFGSTVCPSLP